MLIFNPIKRIFGSEEELALGLDKYVEQLQAISAQASKEYALEKVALFIYFFTFSLYENPSFTIVSAETKYISTRS
jgi:hypothetical protein